MSHTLNHAVQMLRQHWPEGVPEADYALLRFVHTLHRAKEAEDQRASEVLSRYGLSLAEFDVLASLRRCPPPWELTPGEVQQSVLLTSGGLTKVLQQLEAKGFVTRSTSSADRRVKPVRLAPEAAPVLDAAIAELSATVGSWMRSKLSAEEVAQLSRLLARLAWDEGVNDPAIR